MSKGLKIFLSVLALISIGISLAILFDWNPLQKIKTGLNLTNTISSEILENDSKKEDIAKITLSWLNSQKNEEGIYLMGYSCLKEENIIYSSRIFPSVLWGKLKYYEKNSDKDGISDLEKELDLAIKTPTQNNQWNCKLMGDFWESSLLSREQKEKSKIYCRDAGGEGYNNLEMYDVVMINSDQLEEVVLKNIENIIGGSSTSFKKLYFDNSDSSTYDFEKASAYSSNYATRYLLEKEEGGNNQEILDSLAKSSLANYFIALQGYSVINKSINNNSLLGVASLDLYRITDEQKYLDMALYLFTENEKLETNNVDYNYDYVYFGFFAKDFFRITGDETYKRKLNSIKDKIISERFVYPICKDFEGTGNSVVDEGKGGFESGIPNTYFMGENYLILGLLSL